MVVSIMVKCIGEATQLQWANLVKPESQNEGLDVVKNA